MVGLKVVSRVVSKVGMMDVSRADYWAAEKVTWSV